MKNNIRNKLFLQFVLIIVLFMSILFSVNTWLLEPFYIESQKNELLDFYKQLNQLDFQSDTTLFDQIYQFENKSSVKIIIFDQQNKVIYSSQKLPAIHDPLQQEREPFSAPIPLGVTNDEFKAFNMPFQVIKHQIINDKIQFSWLKDMLYPGDILSLNGYLDNGYFLGLQIHLVSVLQSVRIFNTFILYLGLFMFVIALVISYFLSKYFVKPIQTINGITSQMKHLDFSKKCLVDTNDEFGQLSESINELSDILKNNIDAINQKNIQLELEIAEKNKIDLKRKDLLNNVSHELKTPIALLQGYAEGLKSNIVQSSEKKDFYCDVIIDEATKMNQLVTSLLSLNQIEFGDLSLNKTVFSASDLVQMVLSRMDVLYKDNPVHIVFEPMIDAQVWADMLKADQVLTNYIRNAIAYCNEQKQIEITLSIVSDNHLRIIVKNSTDGLNAIEYDKIWDSFYKVDPSHSRTLGGHGLGLAIVKALQTSDSNAYGVYAEENMICFYFDLDL